MGYYVYMDENGDAEGNYSLVSFCEVNSWRKSNAQNYAFNESLNVTGHGWLKDDQNNYEN